MEFVIFADNLRGASWIGLRYSSGNWIWDDNSNSQVSDKLLFGLFFSLYMLYALLI